jgi:hypothetical protein
LADQRITQLPSLPKAGVAATDVLPIADISASQTKKVTAKDLVDAGLDLIDVSSIDLDKLDQASVTKLGTTALADDAVTAAKLAHDSSIAVQTTAHRARITLKGVDISIAPAATSKYLMAVHTAKWLCPLLALATCKSPPASWRMARSPRQR